VVQSSLFCVWLAHVASGQNLDVYIISMHYWVPDLVIAQVINLFNITARNFPDADIQVSTLDAYFELLIAEAPKLKLPVVTGEIGDTWIYGMPCSCQL